MDNNKNFGVGIGLDIVSNSINSSQESFVSFDECSFVPKAYLVLVAMLHIVLLYRNFTTNLTCRKNPQVFLVAAKQRDFVVRQSVIL